MIEKSVQKEPTSGGPTEVVAVEGASPPGNILQKRRLPKWLFYLTIFGPGLIATTAGNDAGGIATYSSMGSQFGYQMLWVMVVLTVGMGVVQEMCARMGAVTGKGLSDLIRENFSIRLTLLVLFTLLIANGGIIVSEFIGIAAAMDIFGIPQWISAPIAGAVIWYLIARSSYQRVEKVFLAFTFVFFTYVVAGFMAKPDWGQTASGSFVPTLRFSGDYLAVLIAAVGTTISPYMQIYVQSAVVERGVTLRDYKYEKIDVYVGAVFSNVISWFIILATAATLFASSNGKGVQLGSAADAAKALEPFLGAFAKYIFALGLLGASVLAAAVLPLTTCYSLTEGLGLENGVSKRWKDAPVFWIMFTVLIVIGVVIAMLPGLPVVDILVNLYLLNGILLPVILFAILRLVNNQELMGEHTNGKVFNLIAYVLAIVISLLSIFYLVTQVLNLFGIALLG